MVGFLSGYDIRATDLSLCSLKLLVPEAANVKNMAPSLEEPNEVDISAPLKATPKLVAPEPGMAVGAVLYEIAAD